MKGVDLDAFCDGPAIGVLVRIRRQYGGDAIFTDVYTGRVTSGRFIRVNRAAIVFCQKFDDGAVSLTRATFYNDSDGR